MQGLLYRRKFDDKTKLYDKQWLEQRDLVYYTCRACKLPLTKVSFELNCCGCILCEKCKSDPSRLSCYNKDKTSNPEELEESEIFHAATYYIIIIIY